MRGEGGACGELYPDMSDLMKHWVRPQLERDSESFSNRKEHLNTSEGRVGAGRKFCSSREDASGLKEKRALKVELDGP